MTDSSPLFRAELGDFLSILAPQIGGLDDLTRTTMSAASIDAITEQLVSRKRRRDLIQALLVAMDDLEGDGYPDLPAVSVSAPLLEEIQTENAAIGAAIGIFGAEPLASRIASKFGDAVPK